MNEQRDKILKDFYHEAHEDHEELTGDKKTFVSFEVSISLYI